MLNGVLAGLLTLLPPGPHRSAAAARAVRIESVEAGLQTRLLPWRAVARR